MTTHGMSYSTIKDLLDRGYAEILSVENDMFNKIIIVLVDKKHQYRIKLSGSQALALHLTDIK